MRAPTPSQIRAAHGTGESRHFFDRQTMRFFGDTMRNFGSYRDAGGNVYLYRRKAVKHGLRGRWLFNEVTGDLRKDINS